MRKSYTVLVLFLALMPLMLAAQCPIPSSAADFTPSATTVCGQTAVTFTVDTPDPNYTYTWDFGDPQSGSSNTATGTTAAHSFTPNASGANYTVTLTVTNSSSSTQVVNWSNLSTGIAASGNTVYKTASNNSWNTGAASTQSITDNMYFEFVAGPVDSRLMGGLNTSTAPGDYADINFAIYTRFDGTIRVFENGSDRGTYGTYQPGDRLRVAAENGVINYYRNGTLFYTSSVSPSFPMYPSVSIRNPNDTLYNGIMGYACTATNSQVITTSATPEIDITGTWDRCTAVDNLGFTNTLFQINNPIPGQAYTWDFGDGTAPITSFNQIMTHTYNNHGVYTVTVTTTDPVTGCVGTYTNDVLYLERPLANMVVVGTADICEGDTVYVANGTDTTNIDYFVLDWGDGIQDTVTTTDTLSHVYNFSDQEACQISQGGEPYTITLYAVNRCFSHTNSSPITVTATPRADFDAPRIVCESANAMGGVNFSANVCPTPTDIFSDLNNYLWDFGDTASAQNSSTFSAPTHVFSGPGEYTVTVQLIANCGTYYDTMVVHILENPEASYTYTATPAPSTTVNGDGCSPLDVVFNNTSTGDSITFEWQIQTNVNGGYSFINGTSDTSTNPQINFSQPGDYIVRLTATNICDDSEYIDTIRVLDGPTVSLAPASPTCDTFYYTPNVTYDEGGGGIQTYSWSFPGGTPSTSSDPNPTNIVYTASGTYQVIVEITNECTVASDTISFYVPMTPSPISLSANGNQSTCVDAAAFQLTADSTGGFWSGPGITNGTNGTFNPAVAGEGTHTITYTYQPRDCPATATIDITVNGLPNVDAGSNLTMCINDGIATLTGATPAGGIWSGLGIVDGAAGTFDPTQTGAGVFPVTYTYTDANGCSNDDTRNIRVYGLPQLNLGGDLTECNGPDDITLTAAPTGGTWSGTGITDPAGTFNTVAAGGIGTYTLSYAFTDGNGCTNIDSIEVDVIRGTPVDAGGDTTLCVQGNQMPLATRPSPTGGVWIGPGVVNTGSAYIFYPSIAGLGTHNVIYSLGTGSCEERDTFEVEVIDIPTVVASNDTAVCISEPAFQLSATPAGGIWSGTGITDASLGTFDPSIGVGTYVATYTYTDPITDCQNTDNVTIRVNALPTVSVTGAQTECDNPDDLQLTGFSPSGGTWTGAGIVDASAGLFNSVTAGGLSANGGDTTYVLTYTYTDANGCIDSAFTTLTLTFGDTVEAGPNDTFCINAGSQVLTGYSPLGGSWSGAGVAGNQFFPASAGIGTHTLTYVYGLGSCQKEDTKTITVINIPNVAAGNDTLVCEGTDPITLQAWYPAGGVWSGAGVSGGIFDPSTAGTGVHVLTYTYTNPVTGCQNADNLNITVSSLPNVSVPPSQQECISPTNIQLTGFNPAGGVWSGPGIVDANNGVFNGTVAGGVGTYTLTYTYMDGNGCSNAASMTMEVVAAIVVEAGPMDTVCQYDAPFNLTGYSPAGGTWTGNGITNANTGEFTPGAVTPGTHRLIYTVGSGTCQRSDTTYITVGATPVVNAGQDTLVCADASSFNLWNYSPVGGTWTGSGVVGTRFYPDSAGTGTHTLTYTYINPITGCQASDTKRVTVAPLPTVTVPASQQECLSPDNITLSGYSPTGGTWSGVGVVDNNNGIFNGQAAGGVGVYTLTYTYTDNNGCINSNTLQMTVVDSVSVYAGMPDTVCAYDAPFVLNGFAPNGGIWSGSGISNANTGEFDPGSVAPGTYPLVYSIGSGTCLRRDTTTVRIVATPTVNAGVDIEICADNPAFALTGYSPTGGVWTGAGITDSLLGTFTPDSAGVGTHTLTYTYMESINGCMNSDTRRVTIHALPTISLPDTMSFCDSGDDIILSGYTPTGGVWSGTGIVDANAGVFNTSTAGGIGTYELFYTYTDNNGCVNGDTTFVEVIFGDTIDAGPDLAMCIVDGAVTLTDFRPTSGGTWSGPGIINTAGVFDPATAGVGSHTLTYTFGAGSCRKIDTRNVIVGAVPTVNAGRNLSYCVNDAVDTLGGNSPAGGYWTGAGITDSLGGYFDPATAGVGKHTITYTYINTLTGCENSDTRRIEVFGLPNIYTGDSVEYCNTTANITLSGYTPLGGTWSGPGIVDAQNGIFNSIVAGGEGQYEVYYTVTNGNGCTDMDTLVIDIVFGDTVQAGGPYGVCIDDGLVTLSGYSPLGGTWSGTGIVDATAGVFDPTAAPTNTLITLSYTYGTGTCQKTDTATLFVGTIPQVEAGNNQTVCSADPAFTLSGFVPSSGGVWSGPGIVDTLNGRFDPAIAGAGTHTIRYTYRNDFTGCENTDTKLITVLPAPNVNAGTDRVECNSSSNITLTGYSPQGGVWSGPGIISANNGIFNSIIAGGEGVYTLTYTYTDSIGCTNSDDMVMGVIYGDTVSAGTGFNTCIDGGLVTLSGSPMGGTWSGTGIIDPTGIFDPTVSGTGTHTLTYTYGTGTCRKSDSINVFVSPAIAVNAGNDLTVCVLNAPFTLGGSSPSSGGTWSGAGVTGNTFDPSAAGVGTHIITYDYVNPVTGCAGTDTRLIEVINVPTVSAGSDVTYCNSPNDITLGGYNPAGGTWSGPGIVDAQNGIFNAIAAGGLSANGGDTTYTLTYTYTGALGCSNSDAMVVTVTYGDTVTAGVNQNTCLDAGFLSITGGSPAGGTWSGTGIIDPTGIFDPSIAGIGSHTLTYTYGVGSCRKTATKTVFVSPVITVNAGPDLTVCSYDAAFNMTGFSPSTGGTWSGVGITDTNVGTFDPAVSGTGTFTITYTYRNPTTGCEGTDTRRITVAPPPTANAGPDVTYCNSSNDITLTGASPSGGVWSGAGIVDANAGIFNANTAGGLSANGGDTTYTVIYTFTDANGCVDTDARDITIEYGDTVEAGPNLNVCINAGFVTLTGFSPAGGTWSGTGIIDPAGVFDPTTAGTGTFTLTYTYGTGTCQKTDTRTVFVSPNIPVDAGPDLTVCEDSDTLILTGGSPSGGTWSGAGITNSTTGVFDPSVVGVGRYTITYSYVNTTTGCSGSDTRVIDVIAPPIVNAGAPVTYCLTSDNQTLSGYSPQGGVWTGPGIVDPSGIFNPVVAGGLGYADTDTTYYVVYTYGTGSICEGRDTLPITVIFGDVVDAGANDTLCIDDGQLTLGGYIPATGGTWSGNGIVDGVNGIFDPRVAGAGIHTLTYTYGTGSCQKTDTKTVLVGALPVINAGLDEATCIDNGILTLSGFSPQGGVWTGTGIVDASAGTFDPSVGVGTYTLTYTFTSVLGCDTSATKRITVNPLPTVTSADTLTYCNTPNDVQLTGYFPTNGGTWSGTGVVDAAQGIFNPSIAGGLGFYTLTYSYTDANGCTNQATTIVEVIFGDTVEAGPNIALCISDGLVNMTGFSPFGGSWSGAGIVDPQNGTFDPSQAGTGLHTLTYTYGTGSCQKTDTKTVFVGPIPAVTAGPDVAVCQQDAPFTLSNASPAGGTWSGPGVTTGGVFTPQLLGAGAYTLTYTYVNSVTGCSNTDQLEVTVVAPPAVDAGGPITFCNTTQNITLSGYTPTGGLWNGPGVIDGINGIFNAQSAGGIGTYQVVYSFTNSIGCTNRDTLEINVIFGDTVEAGTPDTLCIDNGIFVLSGYSPLNGTWSGTGIVDPALGTFDPTIAGTGTHTLTYTYGTGTCRKSDSKTIFVDALPVVNAGVDQTICIDNGTFALSGFSPQGGEWSGTGITDPVAGTFDPALAGTGTFTLSYTYINPITGCQNTDQKRLTVAPLPAVSAGTDVVYCNTPDQITLNSGTPTGGVWSGPGITDANAGVFSTILAGGLAANGGDTTYYVTYTYTDGNGCINSDDLAIEVIYGDTVLAGSNQSICIDAGLITLTDFSPAGGTWSGTGITNAAGTFDPTVAGLGLHTLTYTYGTGTCEKTATKTIFVGAPPVVSAGIDQTVCIDNGAYQLGGFSPLGGYWTGAGVDSSGYFNPATAGVGTHTLTYTFVNNVTGCEASDTRRITVAPLPVVNTAGLVIYCDVPDNITLTGYSPQGGVWSGAGIVDANAGIFNTQQAGGLAANGGDTTYTLTYTYTDNNSCVNSAPMQVTVTFGDTVLAGTNQSLCIDAGLVTLNGFSPAGGSWTGPGITDPSGIFDPTSAGLGTHTLTYTFGTGTCEKTATKTIFVGAPPVISAGVDQTVCIDNGAFQLSGYSPIGGTWTGTGVDSSGRFNPATAGVGTHTLTYTFINRITGCTASDIRRITVAPLPTVTTAGTVLYCDIPSNISLTGYTPAGGVWTGPGIVDANAGIFNTAQAGGLAANGGDTTYALTYTYTDNNGCINSAPMLVDVTYGDTVLAGTNQAVCIDAGLITLSGFSPAGGSWSGTGIIDPVVGIFDPQTAGLGTHVLTYTYGAGTCEKTATKTIFVGSVPTVVAGPDLSFCIDNGTIQLTNNSPLGGTWTGVGITDASNGFFDPAVAGAGSWTLTYTFVNAVTGCEAFDTRVITINPLPTVTTPDSLEFCNTGTNIVLSGYSPQGGTWTGTGIVDANAGIFNTQIAGGEGNYTIVYNYTDVNGCRNRDTTAVTVIFGDTIDAGPDFALCISDAPQLLTGFRPVGGTWSGPGITDPSGVFDPQAAGPGLHVLTLTTGAGTCEKTDTREVFVGEIPNVTAGPDEIVCGTNADFALTGFSPPGGFWTGVGVDSAGTFSPSAATPGVWTLTYTYVNPTTGCSNFDTKVIEVERPPVVNAGGTVTYCNTTDNITLTGYSPVGGTWRGAGIVDGLNGIFNTAVAGGLAANGGDTTYQVIYTYSSGSGCFGVDTLDIVVTFGDTVRAGVNDTICIDDGQITLQGASPAGGTWSGTGIIDAALGIFDPSVAGAGLHVLSYTYGTGTCEKTATKTVFVGALPLVNAGNNEVVCIDVPRFSLSNYSPQGGIWVGVGVDSSGNFDAATAGVGTWTLTYIYTNSITGCDNFDTKRITVAPLPQVNVGDTVEYCNTPNDILLSGYSPQGGTWAGTGITDPNVGIFSTVLAGGIGQYELEYTYTDANGCTNSDSLVVEVVFGDTVFAGTQLNMCIDDGIITLTGYTPPSGGTWSGPGIVDPSAGTFDPQLAGAGLHTLTYTFGTGTCEKTSTRNVFVGTPPVVDAGADLTICEDRSAFTLPSFSPVGGTWTGTGVTANGTFNPALTGVGVFTLTYTFVNNVTGCENFDTRVVEVVPLPTVNVSDSLEFCINNNNIPLTTLVNTTPTTGLVWSGAGIVDPQQGIFNATIAGGIGTYPIVVGYTDGNGCRNTDTLVIDVIFGDTVEAGPDDTLCINENPILLTGFSPAGGTWTGAGVDPISGTFDPATAGVGTHILTYTYGSGTCEKSDTRRILVGALPTINIGPNQTVCIDATAFTLSGYSPQGGTWSGVGITDANAGVFDPAVAGVGTHILTYQFANSITGCIAEAQRTITVAPLPVVDAGDTILICNNPDDFTLTGYSPQGGTWSGSGVVNASAGVINTVIAGGLGSNNADTTYFLNYQYTDGNGCINNDTLVVNVEFGDSIEAGPNEALCIDLGLYQLTGFLPRTNGVWSGPGIVDPINGVFDPQAAGPGPHTLTITTGTGTCEKTDTKIIFVGTPPVVNPGNNQSVCADDVAFNLTGFSPPGGVWSGVGITDSTGVYDPQVSGVGTFTLTYRFVNSVTNCEAMATKTVTVNALPFVDAGGPVTYCDNPNDIVLGGYTPSAGGFWSGPGITNPSQGIFNTVNAGGIGTYQLAYDYTDPFTGCANSDTLLVDVIFGDTVRAGLDDTLCVDDLPYTLSGSPAGGRWSGTGITNGNLGIFNPAVAGGGTHVLTYTYGTGTCEKTDTKIVFVGLPVPVNAGNDRVVCVDATGFALTAQPVGGLWSGNGITNQVSGTFEPSVAQVGVHNITYTYTHPITGCVSMDTVVIEVRALPVVTTAGAVTFCDFPDNVALPTPNLTPGIWSGAGVVDINNGLFNSQVAGGLAANGGDTTYTLTYTYTDAFGCSNSAPLNVNITYGDSVLAGPDRVICIDDNPLTLTGFSPLGGTWTGTGISNANGVFDPSLVTAGTYPVIYTQGTGTCVKSDTLRIRVVDVTNTTAGPDESFCFEDGLVTLSGNSPQGGVWSGLGIQNANLGTLVTQAAGNGVVADTVQVFYTYTDPASGCAYTDSKNVIIQPLPTVNFTAPDTACAQVPISFTNTSVDALTFKWYFGDGDSSVFLSPTHTYDTSGLYTVTLIAFSDEGCPDTTTRNILIYEVPQADFALSTYDGCGPLTVNFTNLTSVQNQNVTYSWDFGNGLTSAQANPPAQTYMPGIEDTTYVISLTVSNRCGTTTFVDSFVVRPQPRVNFVADNNFGCGPLEVNFSNASTGGPNSYFWDFGNGQTSTDTVPGTVTFTIPDTFAVTYWVTLTATNSCGTDVDSLSVTVIPGSVNAGLSADVTSGCEPLTVNFSSAVQSGDNVQWIFGDGNGSVQLNPTHVFDTVGVFTVYQIVTNQCGADTATVQIEVYPQPDMNFSHLPYTCVGDGIQFNNNATPIAGTLWDFGDGTTSTLNSPTHVYNAPGFYTVYITNYSVTHLCPLTDSTIVEVKEVPNASFTPDVTTGCAPLTINFTNNSTGAFQSWFFSDSNVTINANPVHTFDTAGQYFVTLTTTDQFGCSNDTTWTGIVAYPKPNASFIPSDPVQCGLDATVTLQNTSTDASAYFWDFGNGTFSNLTSPTISYNNQGDHIITLQASNTFGCADTIQDVFTTLPAPFADFDLQPQVGCEPLPVQFIQRAINANGYFWRFGDGETSTQANPIHVYSAGAYNVTFIASIDDMCFDSITVVDAVFAESSPVADFEVLELDPNNPTGQLLFNNLTTGATRYEWEFGDGTFSSEESPVKEYFENGQRIVRLIAWNDQGCSDTLVKVIEPMLFKGLFVPNAFSPDAGIGDVRIFKPVGVGLQEYRVQVYAQWGELLWESTLLDDAGRPVEGWDGYYNGRPMPQGAYVWKVEGIFRDGSQWDGQENTLGQRKKIGSVTILR